MCQIEINGVSITLTEEQLKQIDNQRNNKLSIETLTIEQAYRFLSKNREVIINAFNSSSLSKERIKQLIAEEDLMTLIEVMNYLNNNNSKWIPNFKDSNKKYYIYFSGGGLFYSLWYDSFANVPLGLHLKTEKSAEILIKNFPNLLKDYFGIK